MSRRANSVAKRASVAPRTVTEVSEGKHAARKQKNRKAPQRKASPVDAILVRPDVWEAAKALSCGEPGRLLVVGSEEVIVCNTIEHKDMLKKEMKKR